MKNFFKLSLLLSVFLISLSSCSDTENTLPPSLTLTSDLTGNAVVNGRSATFKITAISLAEIESIKWILDGNEVGNTEEITLQINGEGNHLLVVNVKNIAGTSCKAINFNATPKELATATILTSIKNKGTVLKGKDLTFTANIESTTDNTFRWILNGSEVSKDAEYVFNGSEYGDQELTLEITNEDGVSNTPFLFRVVGPYGSGIFVLNEGNMSSENGFVNFINNKGVQHRKAYLEVNGRPLGNTVQNMYVNDEHIYFICQNGNRMGGDMLVMANAQTLEQEGGFNDELSNLSWPTHVVAVDPEHVYIRDNKGVSIFNTINKELTFVEGTNGAAKNQMVAINDKVYVMARNNVLVLNNGSVENTIEMGASVSGLIKSFDNNLWVAVKSSPNKIVKIDSTTGQEMASKDITISGLSAGWGATPSFGAYKNIIYYNNAGVKVNKLDFITGICTEVANCKDISDIANMAYNNVSVDPRNGYVYMHTIKGYGMDYLENDLIQFLPTEEGLKASNDYKNYLHFPTGCYFTKY